MRRCTYAVLLAALGALSPCLGADVRKLRGGLADIVTRADHTELIPVTIVMRAQAAPEQISRAALQRDKAARRSDVRRILKRVAGEAQRDLLRALHAAQQNGSVGPEIRALWVRNVIVANVNRSTALEIAARPDVAYLNYNRKVAGVLPVEPEVKPGGGPLASIDWGVDHMQAPRVWNELDITGRGVVVCVIDTGCCFEHPDLVHQTWTNPGEVADNGIDDDGNGFVDDLHGWNFYLNNNDLTDTHGHGTHTAGTVAGDGTNGNITGMAPDAAIMACKYLDDLASESMIWESMQYALDNGADIVSASLGWSHHYDPDRATWRAVCENMMEAGLVLVYAAGNEGWYYDPVDNIRTPGDVPDVITVGATYDTQDLLWVFSSRGPVTWQDVAPYNDWPYPPGKIKPSVAAPGFETLSTSNDCSGYRIMTGTSMATPHVAGAAALVLEANPALDHYGVREVLMTSAIDRGAEGPDNLFGAGRADAYLAVVAALDGSPCTGDLDGDGDTDQSDLGVLLAAFGVDADGDLDGDGDTDQSDLGILLADWNCGT